MIQRKENFMIYMEQKKTFNRDIGSNIMRMNLTQMTFLECFSGVTFIRLGSVHILDTKTCVEDIKIINIEMKMKMELNKKEDSLKTQLGSYLPKWYPYYFSFCLHSYQILKISRVDLTLLTPLDKLRNFQLWCNLID